MKTIVSKGEYARLKGRAASAVSNWIAEGKVTAAALIGEGNRARIWVEQADRDLAASLDPVQQALQEKPIIAPAAADPAVAAASEPAAPATPKPAADVIGLDDIARRRRADADRAEVEAQRAKRNAALEEGRLTDADAARGAWARQLAKQQAELETFLGAALPQRIADEHGLDWKALSVLIRGAYRSYRETAADEAEAALAEREQDIMQEAAE